MIVEKFLTKNRCFKNRIPIKVKGLMLHSVGCPQPKASVFIGQFNRPDVSKCVHAFIDGNDGIVYQTLPWNWKAWHCGGRGNSTHIGVEMCEPAKWSPETVKRVYDSAVELFADLCTKFGLNPLTDIVGHYEGRQKGIASNHIDPKHLFDAYGYSMDGFRKAVQEKMVNV